MYETLFSLELAVGENMKLLRKRILPKGMEVICDTEKINSLPRISIVTGIHGDEMEGQYICYELIRRIEKNMGDLCGIVDIYPAVNLIGLDDAMHTIPKERIDMNKMFPGSSSGTMMERMAAALADSIIGSDICLDIHGSDIFIKESLQIRLNEDFADKLMPYARIMDANIIWKNPTPIISASTLVHSMNCMGVPSMTIECGVGNSLNKKEGERIVNGIFNIMSELKIWSGETYEVTDALVCDDSGVDFIRAEAAGLFLLEVEEFIEVKRGQLIGKVVDVMNNKILQKVRAVHDGLIFTVRQFPMVYEGALLFRILVTEKEGLSEEKEGNVACKDSKDNRDNKGKRDSRDKRNGKDNKDSIENKKDGEGNA